MQADDPFGSPMPAASESDLEKSRLIHSYLELSAQIKALEAELDKVKDAIRDWLDDGELVSDGKHFATYQVRVLYDYDEKSFKDKLPFLYDRVVSVDSKKIKKALDSELVTEEELNEVRTPKESKALYVKTVEM